MKFALVLGSITLAAVVAAVPQFPDTWQSGTVSGIAIFQGGVKKPDGLLAFLPSF